MKKPKIGVIIASSLNRNDLLFSRSLYSVLNQKQNPDYVLIVDDNQNESASKDIERRIFELKNNKIHYIKNLRTPNMSGTGAWNSGIKWYEKIFTEDDYVAILDDDDSWRKEYINSCYDAVTSSPKMPDAVFAFIKRSDCDMCSFFDAEDISINNFLKGNPGIQGSNMFFRFGALKSIGGFDEKLASSTDRDLMIRFLQKHSNENIKIIPKILVNHFVSKDSVTSNFTSKTKGLNSFHTKYIKLYSQELLEQALQRAKKLFNYQESENIKKIFNLVHKYSKAEKIVIGVAVHNNKNTLRRGLKSILGQKGVKRDVWILIADDDSNDDWKKTLGDILKNEKIVIIDVKNHHVAKTRNNINRYIRTLFEKVSFIGRLDADDEYADQTVLSKIERKFDDIKPDVLVAGNYLRLDGKIIDRVNIATSKLDNKTYLLNRLKQMSEGVAQAELPSCNLFITPNSLQDYPEISSAEDHFLLVRLLLNDKNLKIEFAEDILLTIYNLSGNKTADNKQTEKYLNARKQLYEEAMRLCKMKQEN
ncbi:MAG: glycosyltransferase family 2 protein [Campylobacter sp.]